MTKTVGFIWRDFMPAYRKEGIYIEFFSGPLNYYLKKKY